MSLEITLKAYHLATIQWIRAKFEEKKETDELKQAISLLNSLEIYLHELYESNAREFSEGIKKEIIIQNQKHEIDKLKEQIKFLK